MKKIYLLFFSLFILTYNTQGQALSFDGVNDYVLTTSSGVSGGLNRTIEAWIKTNKNYNPSAGGTQGVILDYGTFVNGQRFTFNILWSNAIRLEVGGNGVSGTIPVNDGNWHHVAVVLSPNNNISLYVDGALDAQGTLTVAANTGTTNKVTIGKRIDNINYFDGVIDEVRIWNTARTAAEIQANMNKELCNTSNSNLVAYYKLNHGTPSGNNSMVTTATDYSSNNNNGTLSGFALTGNTSNWIVGKTLSSGNTASSFSVSACGSYTAPNGTVYNSSQTITNTIPNAIGCDSVITINLTIAASQSTTQNVMACDSFVTASGQIYYNSQTIVNTLTGTNGCDSTVTTNITIYNNTSNITNITECGFAIYNGQTYTSSQTLTNSYTTSTGCDSTETVNITINNANTGVTLSGDVLTATATNSTFQWINCATNALVNGAASATFTPTASGSYAVIVTSSDNCVDTSSCTAVILSGTEQPLATVAKCFPNPTSGQLNIDLGTVYENVELNVLSIDGRTISNHFYKNAGQIQMDMNVAPGFYFIKVKTEKGSAIFKVGKE